ncbi:MAG: hypothetical protein ACI8QZ_002864 [Chlamydiales bacterium]|jgi:hypothetical protein
MKPLIAFLVAPFAIACQVSGTASSTPAPTTQALLPTNVEQIVERYQEQAGVTLTYSETTAKRLRAITVAPVGPAGDVLLIDADPQASVAFEIWPLQHAEAATLAAALERLVVSAGTFGGSRIASDIGITADNRTNSLLVCAPAERLADIKALVERLDIEQPSEG